VVLYFVRRQITYMVR